MSQRILGKSHQKQIGASYKYSRLFEPMSEGLGCGDKHSVVDSDKNSAKFIKVNNSCMGVTCITAGMWSTPALGEQ